jgi:glycine cleavage system regulatory protein
MQLRIGDRLTDETGTYEVVARPHTTAGGKTVNVRVKRLDSETTMVRISGAHERVAVKRTGGCDGKRRGP